MACGGDKDSAAVETSYPQNGASLYQRGDSVRGRVTVRSKTGVTERYEVVTRVGDISADLGSYRIDKIKISQAQTIVQPSEWVSHEELSELYFTSPEQLQARCGEMSGRVLSLSLVDGTVTGCRVVSNWTQSGISGGGETWLGVVPFGILKRNWSSKDGLQKMTFETLSYIRNGVHRSLSAH